MSDNQDLRLWWQDFIFAYGQMNLKAVPSLFMLSATL